MKGDRRGGKRVESVGIGVGIGGLGMWYWRCSGVCLLGGLLLCWGSRSQNCGPHIILPVIAIQISPTLLHEVRALGIGMKSHTCPFLSP